MKYLVLFVMLTVGAYSQTFTDLFDGKSVNSTTTNGATIFALTNTNGNTFDTLKVFITGGSDVSTDSAHFAVHVQSYVMGSWSQGILIDSITAAGSRKNIFTDSSVGSVKLLNDTIKARWFYGQTLSTEAKNALKARTDWKFRIYLVGKASGNTIATTGGTAKVTQVLW